MITLLRAADRRATPWKNGVGITWEIAAFPAGAGMDDFAWRLSIAEVVTETAFSVFPNVDRILAVIEGELALTVEGAPQPVRLNASVSPYAFAGDANVRGDPVAGPVRDLNLMVRRGHRASMARLNVETPLSIGFNETAIVVAMDNREIAVGDERFTLAPLDALLIQAAGAVRAPIQINAAGFIVMVQETDV